MTHTVYSDGQHLHAERWQLHRPLQSLPFKFSHLEATGLAPSLYAVFPALLEQGGRRQRATNPPSRAMCCCVGSCARDSSRAWTQGQLHASVS